MLPVMRLENRLRLARMKRVALALPMLLLPLAARAQAVGGAIDPTTGLSQLAPWLLTLAGGAITIITMYKGAHAVAEGRSLGPAIVGMISGIAICYGGYYILQHYGASTT
jgi:hypothetical protein